jgi:tryptophan-rich sensory protein
MAVHESDGGFTRDRVFLLVPYLAWVTFATVLNFQFWQVN